MARWTASAEWAAGPALDGQCDMPLALRLSEVLGPTRPGPRCLLSDSTLNRRSSLTLPIELDARLADFDCLRMRGYPFIFSELALRVKVLGQLVMQDDVVAEVMRDDSLTLHSHKLGVLLCRVVLLHCCVQRQFRTVALFLCALLEPDGNEGDECAKKCSDEPGK